MVHKPDARFSRYVRQIRPTLRRQAFLLCGDWHEADDLVQETLIKILRRWTVLDRKDELFAYTHTVMMRTFVSAHRASRWSREFIADQLPEPNPQSDDQESVADRLLLVAALARLAPGQRAVIVLRYWEHLTVEEAANALSCSPTTIRSQTSRALANLRSLLQDDLYP